jgi:hypothetical protein
VPSQEREEPGLLTPGLADQLATAELEVVGRLPHSSNGTYLVRCNPADSRTPPLAVYKPAAGERALWDFSSATLYRREVAAYELSHWLGWDLVPPTVVREVAPLGPGSLQAFVDHDPSQHYFSLVDAHRETFRRMAFFDLLANNADRKAGHCLLGSEGRIWGIDHGLMFHTEAKLRTVIWEFATEPLPAAERRAAARLAKALGEGAGDLSPRLLRLLTRAEVDALGHRAAMLARAGRFPRPESSWSFPWPLV